MPLIEGEAERRSNLAWLGALHQECCWHELGVLPGSCRPRPREELLVMLAIQKPINRNSMALAAVDWWADWEQGLRTLPRHQQRGIVALGLLGEGEVDVGADWLRLTIGEWHKDERSDIWLSRAKYWKPFPPPPVLQADARAGVERIARWLWRRKPPTGSIPSPA